MEDCSFYAKVVLFTLNSFVKNDLVTDDENALMSSQVVFNLLSHARSASSIVTPSLSAALCGLSRTSQLDIALQMLQSP